MFKRYHRAIVIGTAVFFGSFGLSFAASTDATTAVGANLAAHPDNPGLANASIRIERNQERVEKSETPEKVEHVEVARPEKMELPEKVERVEVERPEKVERPERVERPEQIERPERVERPEQIERPDNS